MDYPAAFQWLEKGRRYSAAPKFSSYFDDDRREFMAEYARMHTEMMKRAGESAPALRIETGRRKIGRNEPCPCGSGKKFKKCCGK